MINALPEDLQLLWKLAGVVEPLSLDNNWNTYFESIGLILLTPEEGYGRDCLIPINSLIFATTGGGSVHFSLLALDGSFTNDSPVIMTVPN